MLIFLLAALVLGWLTWLCVRDPKINFPRPRWPGGVDLFPKAMEGGSQRIANMDTVFRREFTLDAPPRSARLELRAAKRAELQDQRRTQLRLQPRAIGKMSRAQM